ncbi:MAG: ATP-binding protein [Candidatus Diapherotrites archaeon]|nr:ATP-binding protein [Candidatus Diapherotrites archaeon]
MRKFESTKELRIKKTPLEQVIGQENAVEIAKIAARQRRNLLLVGPPGIGKSMIGDGIASLLPKPEHALFVVNNPDNPQRPTVVVRNEKQIRAFEKKMADAGGSLVRVEKAPRKVTEILGYRCSNCGTLSSPNEESCPQCGKDKFGSASDASIEDALKKIIPSEISTLRASVEMTQSLPSGKKERCVYQRHGERTLLRFGEKAIKKQEELEDYAEAVLVPLERSPFVEATGASETEILGDVRHDPYGGGEYGVLPFERVVPGAVHESHEGVLFIDEISHIRDLQRSLLTAMQKKTFSIVGKNPQSAGASVKVIDVPCDFMLVAASNIVQVEEINPALRSRITGNGYEILLNTFMPDTKENREKFAFFVAQEIRKDNSIPHASSAAVDELLKDACKRAKVMEGAKKSITLRLRSMGGIVRMAGDMAVAEDRKLIERSDVKEAVKKSVSIEEQIVYRYGSVSNGLRSDFEKKLGDKNYFI